MTAYEVRAIPDTILIDPDGRIRARFAGRDEEVLWWKKESDRWGGLRGVAAKVRVSSEPLALAVRAFAVQYEYTDPESVPESSSP